MSYQPNYLARYQKIMNLKISSSSSFICECIIIWDSNTNLFYLCRQFYIILSSPFRRIVINAVQNFIAKCIFRRTQVSFFYHPHFINYCLKKLICILKSRFNFFYFSAQKWMSQASTIKSMRYTWNIFIIV